MICVIHDSTHVCLSRRPIFLSPHISLYVNRETRRLVVYWSVLVLANAVLCFLAKEMSGSVLSHAGWRASVGLLRRTALFMLLTGAYFAHWGRPGRKWRKCTHARPVITAHSPFMFSTYRYLRLSIFLNWQKPISAIMLVWYCYSAILMK